MCFQYYYRRYRTICPIVKPIFVPKVIQLVLIHIFNTSLVPFYFSGAIFRNFLQNKKKTFRPVKVPVPLCEVPF